MDNWNNYRDSNFNSNKIDIILLQNQRIKRRKLRTIVFCQNVLHVEAHLVSCQDVLMVYAGNKDQKLVDISPDYIH
jgi:hypothetical protein